VTASRAVTTEAPQLAEEPAGQDPGNAHGALTTQTLTLCSQRKSTPFCKVAFAC